jgi:hypothetical protein
MLPPQMQHMQQSNMASSSRSFTPQTAAPGLPDWASDFQRLHVSNAPLSQTQRFPQPQNAFQQNANVGGWATDFMQVNQQQSPVSMNQSRIQPFSQQSNFGISMGGIGMQGSSLYGGVGSGMNASQSYQQQQQLPQDSQVSQAFDEQAFEREFEAAAQAEMTQQDLQDLNEESQRLGTSQQHNTELGQDILINESAERMMGDHMMMDSMNDLENLEPVQEEQKEEIREEDNPDELARTAGQLLDSVSDNTSQKFQESTFLALMRRLRDREVRVEGDKMVEVSVPVAHKDYAEEAMTAFVRGRFSV